MSVFVEPDVIRAIFVYKFVVLTRKQLKSPNIFPLLSCKRAAGRLAQPTTTPRAFLEPVELFEKVLCLALSPSSKKASKVSLEISIPR